MGSPKLDDDGIEVLVEVTRGEAFASSIENLALSLKRPGAEPLNDSPNRMKVQRNGMIMFETETHLLQDDVVENLTAEVVVQEYGGESHGPDEMPCSCEGICDYVSAKNFTIRCLMPPNASVSMNNSAITNETANTSTDLEGDLPAFAAASTEHMFMPGHGKADKMVHNVNASLTARAARPQRMRLPSGGRITTKKAKVLSARATHMVVGVVAAVLSMALMAVCAFERRKVIVMLPQMKPETSAGNGGNVDQEAIGASYKKVSSVKTTAHDSDSESDFDYYWA